MTAIKPVYQPKLRDFVIQVQTDANPLLAHDGWLVFDGAFVALAKVNDGVLIPHWTERKRQAVINWLAAMG